MDQTKFFKDGWDNFLKFFADTYSKMGLSSHDIVKSEKFYAFIYTYIGKGFIVPTEKEVQLDNVMRKLKSIDNKKKE